MRGSDENSGALFSYIDLEERVPVRHPLRTIRRIVNDALASLDADFEQLYSGEGRPSIPPERLIRASLLQILFSELRQLRAEFGPHGLTGFNENNGLGVEVGRIFGSRVVGCYAVICD